ncbi:MAG: hypothetical protein R3F11_05605 [Verrucomicrobiales bacterium]
MDAKSQRIFIAAGSVAVLLWGAVMVYFYTADRMDIYLKGNFRIQALIGGLGMLLLGAFNLMTPVPRSPAGTTMRTRAMMAG